MLDILSQIKPKIATVISEDSYKTWIEPLTLLDYKNNTCFVVVPNAFFKDWIVENFEPLLLTLLKDTASQSVKIEYILNKENGSAEKRLEKKNVLVRKSAAYNQFNPKYVFETFVVGSSNQFANAACLAVATNPGKTYNPLFIYGGVGLGKTHLLNAIGNFVLGHGNVNPDRICYITAETFTNELINSIRFEKMDDFRNRFRKMDILLIDDIQFIAGKERTMAEFFHTFNALYDNMKQIVVTSDKFPRDIENFEERLKSRFEWGLVADIQSPDLETKVAILNKKAESEKIALPLDVAFFIASNSEDSVRSLEGTLIRVGAYASLKAEPVSIELVKDIMSHIIKEKVKEITFDMILKEVCAHFAVSATDIKSEKRVRSVLVPRQVLVYLSRKLTDLSLVSIGEKLGGKDHATIIHSVKKIEAAMKEKKELKNSVEKIEQRLKST
ncbi:MAG TPA: chromosomal replication initiator protein DnaA [Syntrophorhabdaceae bacterium]|nr:chromosomal replication initiator protein DnaA [Syntrophorhabdaceae bacterium]